MRDTPAIKAAAVQIQAHALAAIESLAAAVDVAVATGDADLVDEVKRGAGISIGTITRDCSRLCIDGTLISTISSDSRHRALSI